MVSILAAIGAALMPLAAAGQVAPERPVAQRAAPAFKYEAFVGEKKIVPKKPDQPESTLKDLKHVEGPTDQPQRLKLSE